MTEDPATRSVRHAPWLAAVVGVLLMLILGTLGSPGGLGINSQTSTKVERDRNWRVIKYSIERNDGKTVWDWFGLIGVPITLAVLGIWFQSQEQIRASRDAEEQRRLATEESKEETLQRYLDRVSQLLIEKDLIRQSNVAHNPIVESASDVIRARTLSVLRSFSQDGERKGSVIFFLIETDVLHKLKVSLAKAHLSGADLSGADLSGADLSDANLSGANLSGANLRGANLSEASLSGAFLREANLIGANLRGVFLKDANLSGADLSEADLSDAFLRGADLSGAFLGGANLREASLREAILREANLCGADLREASLGGADLCGANLSDANLSGSNLCGAKFKDTICPDGKNTDKGCPGPYGLSVTAPTDSSDGLGLPSVTPPTDGSYG